MSETSKTSKTSLSEERKTSTVSSRRNTLAHCDIRNSSTSDFDAVKLISNEDPVVSKAKKCKGCFTASKCTKKGGVVLFDRGSGCVWNPHFESKILENQYQKCFEPITMYYFNIFLFTILATVIVRIIGIVIRGTTVPLFYINLSIFTVICIILACIISLYALKSLKILHDVRFIAVVSIGIIFIVNINQFVYTGGMDNYNDTLKVVGNFSNYMQLIVTILLFYIMVPLKLIHLSICSVLLSILCELIFFYFSNSYIDVKSKASGENMASMISIEEYNKYFYISLTILARIIMMLMIHIIGIYLNIINQVHRRSTFLNVTQSLMMQQQLKVEEKVKSKVIYSLMPPQIANQVIKLKISNEGKENNSSNEMGEMPADQQGNVSIIFADIVGFTKMSSNKTAERLVYMLNDLFGRFDEVCQKSGCEKIATLGDCYYAVSGCPEPREDHAKCVVECGLGMIRAIKEFDEDHNEEVNMRIGVHSGTVLYGVIGTTRFKFDVWSNDVTLANIMESEGEAGRVHVSESTVKFLNNEYELEPYKSLKDIRSETKLIEKYTKDEGYVVAHQTDKGEIETFLIKGRNVAGRITPTATYCNINAATKKHNITQDNVRDNATDNMLDLLQKLYVTNAPQENDNSIQKNEQSRENTPKKENENDNSPLLNVLIENDDNKTTKDNIDDNIVQRESQNFEDDDDDEENESDDGVVDLLQEDDVAKHFRMPDMNKICMTFKEPSDELNYQHSFGRNLLSKLKNDLNSVDSSSSLRRSNSKEKKKKKQNSKQEKDSPTRRKRQYHATDKLNKMHLTKTFESPLVMQTMEYTLVSFLTILMFLSLQFTLQLSTCFYVIFTIILVFQLSHVIILGLAVRKYEDLHQDSFIGRYVFKIRSEWYLYNIIGFIMVTCPILLIFSAYQLPSLNIDNFLHHHSRLVYVSVFSLSLCCVTVFSMLRFSIKSLVVLLASVVFITLYSLNVGNIFYSTNVMVFHQEVVKMRPRSIEKFEMYADIKMNSSPDKNLLIPEEKFYTQESYFLCITSLLDISLSLISLLITIIIISVLSEFEYRKTYYRTIHAIKDHEHIKAAQDQSNWLLNNIIPEYVLAPLSMEKKYSESVHEVGIIFAKITNFEEFYEEGFHGGKHYMEALNQIFADFESNLKMPQYKQVEKIKTIGSCLMVASGLNMKTRAQAKSKDEHLIALMDFCMQLQLTLDAFNQQLFNFNFNMAIGYNIGSVVAGVIGVTKLSYDIWADAVNIASRMYSTAETNKIQVTEDVVTKMSHYFDFKYRGVVAVKGKGEMKTYTLVGKKIKNNV